MGTHWGFFHPYKWRYVTLLMTGFWAHLPSTRVLQSRDTKSPCSEPSVAVEPWSSASHFTGEAVLALAKNPKKHDFCWAKCWGKCRSSIPLFGSHVSSSFMFSRSHKVKCHWEVVFAAKMGVSFLEKINGLRCHTGLLLCKRKKSHHVLNWKLH